jgi:hypothetical protein
MRFTSINAHPTPHPGPGRWNKFVGFYFAKVVRGRPLPDAGWQEEGVRFEVLIWAWVVYFVAALMVLQLPWLWFRKKLKR